jgi:hypothetical protein
MVISSLNRWKGRRRAEFCRELSFPNLVLARAAKARYRLERLKREELALARSVNRSGCPKMRICGPLWQGGRSQRVDTRRARRNSSARRRRTAIDLAARSSVQPDAKPRSAPSWSAGGSSFAILAVRYSRGERLKNSYSKVTQLTPHRVVSANKGGHSRAPPCAFCCGSSRFPWVRCTTLRLKFSTRCFAINSPGIVADMAACCAAASATLFWRSGGTEVVDFDAHRRTFLSILMTW